MSEIQNIRRRAFMVDILDRAEPAKFSGPIAEARTLQMSSALAKMLPMLEKLDFSQVEWLTDGAATRETVMSRLEDWIVASQAGDVCLFYYTGHGARIRYIEPDGTSLTDDDLMGLTMKPDVGGQPLLDLELSTKIAQLHEACGDTGSVVVIIDCCHSSDTVRAANRNTIQVRRGQDVFQLPAEKWVRDLIAEFGAGATPYLPVDSHPGVVRLAGASAWRKAFTVAGAGRVGLMTEALVDSVTEALAQNIEVNAQISWGMLVHRVRERVIQVLQFEEQWVTLAGPQDRSLFARENLEVPRSVGFLQTKPREGYLRAGWLGGVRVGDRFMLVEPWLGANGALEVIARGSVTSVDPNRAVLDLDLELNPGARALATCAVLERAATPMPIARARSRTDTELAKLASNSAWVSSGCASVSIGDDRSTVHDAQGRALLEVSPHDHRLVKSRLDDLARRRYLYDLLTGHPSRECGDIGWRVWHHPQRQLERLAAEPGARIEHDDGVSFEIFNDPPNNRLRHWFVTIIHVDVGGRLTLMHFRQPEGLEIGPRAKEVVGRRLGGSARGLRLTWPEGTPKTQSLPASFVMLASRRPMNLANLVRPQHNDPFAAFEIQRLDPRADSPVRVRTPKPRQGPKLADDWSWRRFDIELQPSTT